ncbi:MAG TPA: hypothetical protein VMS00_00550 [Acidimicrobiales bacterium]|nr:hypothetical protein [Acidimicrobiales bacterium]
MTAAFRGAYGLRLGPPLEDSYLVDVPSDWPEWDLEWLPLPPDQPQGQRIGPDEVLLNVLPEGQVLIERALNRSTLFLREDPRPEAWAHPHLSSTAVISAWWFGRRSFHAGGFIVGGGVWGVLGERGDGKSSTLAWLSANGYQVVCDDILVVDGEDALAGPRCLDLRAGAAAHFHLGTYIGHVGTRERWRAALPPVEARTPLRGWVVPAWGDEVSVEAVTLAERLPLLLSHRGLRIPEEGGPTDRNWLVLMSRPMVRFQRPQDWSAVDGAMTQLMDRLAAM